MDITTLFRKRVTSIKSYKTPFKYKSDIIKSVRKNEFIKKIEDISSNATKLKKFLLDHKEYFLNSAFDNITSLVISSTDIEKMDILVRRIVKQCLNILNELSSHISSSGSNTQLYTHQKNVIEIMQSHVTAILKLYSEYKAICTKRSNQYHNMISITLASSENATDNEVNKHDNAKEVPTSKDARLISSEENVSQNNQTHHELSDCEMQLFDLENDQLLNELNGLTMEVVQLEKKASSLAELQEIFTNEVLQQDTQIQRIDNTVSGTSQNVQDANLILRKTIQDSASFRIYLLFFILVLSFSLLFLNWYND